MLSDLDLIKHGDGMCLCYVSGVVADGQTRKNNETKKVLFTSVK